MEIAVKRGKIQAPEKNAGFYHRDTEGTEELLCVLCGEISDYKALIP
jgi:hypothetical protein